jgi:hypothetical protein
MSNDIQFHTYEYENRIIIVLRVEHEVWLGELPPELAEELREVLKGEEDEGGTYRLRPDQLRVDRVEDVPSGTVLPRGSLAPFRRVIYDVVNKSLEVAGKTASVSGTVAVGSWLIAPFFPPAYWVAVESAKVAAIAFGTVCGLVIIEKETDKVRSGYVRFHAQVSDQMPQHKKILAHAEFLGTMKQKHFKKLVEQIEKLDLDAEIAAVESQA